MPEDKNLSVAQTLKKKRQSLKLSLRDVELATKIRGKYLTKFETGDYGDIPNDIYTRGFIGNYAEFLGLDPKVVTKQYLAERGEIEVAPVSLPKPVAQRRFILTPKIFILAGFLVASAAVVAYLYSQFSALAAPPQLEVTAPVADQVIYGSLIDVAGHAGGGSDVFINDSPILTDANGNFSDKLALQDGVNTVRIRAKNKVGKETVLTRNILAHLPTVDATASVPTAVYDGIAIGVTIKGSATGLVVSVDGKEVFKGTMLAGTAQTFKGVGKIVITTSNAGTTNLVITNQAVASKQLSPLGKDGEVKRDLEFAKDTQFP
ncbi:MAG TPA: RodZ domain-containing protein [Candidatus Nanoarchaeia archaeon]|nr:RodZ domain-containing protein [Candidatus Nanoarchaeia archaeon]